MFWNVKDFKELYSVGILISYLKEDLSPHFKYMCWCMHNFLNKYSDHIWLKIKTY